MGKQRYITAEVRLPDGLHRLVSMPMSDESLDQFFQDAGIFGSQLIGLDAKVLQCDIDAAHNLLTGKSGFDVEELNHLAQRIDKLSSGELAFFEALCDKKTLDTPARMINALCTLKDYQMRPDIKTLSDIGCEYAHINMFGSFLHCVDLEELGKSIAAREKGRLLDSGYCKDFYTEKPIHYESGMLFYGNDVFEYDGNYSVMVMLSDKGDLEHMTDSPSAWVRLPASDSALERATARIGGGDSFYIECICPEDVIDVNASEFRSMDLYSLNEYVIKNVINQDAAEEQFGAAMGGIS
jgi:hypothetical protein